MRLPWQPPTSQCHGNLSALAPADVFRWKDIHTDQQCRHLGRADVVSSGLECSTRAVLHGELEKILQSVQMPIRQSMPSLSSFSHYTLNQWCFDCSGSHPSSNFMSILSVLFFNIKMHSAPKNWHAHNVSVLQNYKKEIKSWYHLLLRTMGVFKKSTHNPQVTR